MTAKVRRVLRVSYYGMRYQEVESIMSNQSVSILFEVTKVTGRRSKIKVNVDIPVLGGGNCVSHLLQLEGHI